MDTNQLVECCDSENQECGTWNKTDSKPITGAPTEHTAAGGFGWLEQEIDSILTKQKHGLSELSLKDPSECQDLQAEELSALQAIFADDITLIAHDHCSLSFVVDIAALLGSTSPCTSLKIWFSLPSMYPSVIPIMEVESEDFLTFAAADALFDVLMDEAHVRLQHTMIYDLVLAAKEFAVNVSTSHGIAKTTSDRSQDPIPADADASALSSDDEADPDSEHVSCGVIDTTLYGSSTSRKPSVYTGSLHKILETVPKEYAIVSVENIMRHDLAIRYEMTLAKMESKYFQSVRLHPEEYKIDSTFAFHGTKSDNIPNIVKTGLQVPSQENGIAVANGSSYGVGIYLSTDPSISMHYCENSDNAVLLVCAVTLGRMWKQAPKSFSTRCDSLVAGSFYVIFNDEQVLPCYAIRIASKRGNHVNNSHFHGLSTHKSLREMERANETATEKRDRLAERARKFLPYGFGPVSTRNRTMIVLDAGDSSEEEDSAGDFQEFRYLK